MAALTIHRTFPADGVLLSARGLDADQAAAAGLVEHVVDPEEARQAAIAYAARLAAMPPEAVAALKDAVVRGMRSSLGEGLAIELEHVRKRFGDLRVDRHLQQALADRRKEGSA